MKVVTGLEMMKMFGGLSDSMRALKCVVDRERLIGVAHAAYVKVPNEDHQLRLGRVVDAICADIFSDALVDDGEGTVEVSGSPTTTKDG